MPDPIIATKELLEERFDGWAPSYDEKGIYKERGQRLVDMMDIKPGTSALDVATGTGSVLLPLARRAAPRGRVTGIDMSANMLRRAKQAVAAEGLANAELLKMDAEHLEFPDAAFDVVTCAFGIWFFPPAALDEMHRVCKPGGVFGVTVFEKRSPDSSGPLPTTLRQLRNDYGMGELKYAQQNQFSVEEIQSLLARHGFEHKQTLRKDDDEIYANLEEYWDFGFDGSGNPLVKKMDEGTRARYKKDLFSRLRPLMQPDGLHFSHHVIYLVAQK